ncbi:MAG: helix-turn-helix transcriptional regulator [Clostridia bacterium]|nr:helix-turn-helix transcriptional regulator [Clostridia bacterium]
MDYFKIGERIRKFRKAKGLSQELLAEKVGISVTHMSHIETGNTKLSLPVLVDLARHLEVHTDDLLQEEPTARTRTQGELDEVLSSCSAKQLRVIVDLVKAAKIALDKHL